MTLTLIKQKKCRHAFLQFKTREKSAVDMEMMLGFAKVKDCTISVLKKYAFPN